MPPAVTVSAIEVVPMVLSVRGGASDPRRLSIHHQSLANEVTTRKAPVQIGGSDRVSGKPTRLGAPHPS